ncbi:betaine--homocysteine S-methyltransferase 1-like [Actinia tenebrosa]|uniref:Betaine--homocysteine S-methyltransferase 1-like n=1 Tax=Actinia tenebrosa TaxID=6105 RepID=A0A6P8HTN5_ACTTE|nr:betaine--homocysteine S-methyltransferase 1-like [Actinia tenebrosa]
MASLPKKKKYNMSEKRGILERLDAGEVIIGDGGFTAALEKRGYVMAGKWTPECTVENPEAVRQLHREFLRAGADVMQAFTYSMQDEPVEIDGKTVSWDEINDAACKLAKEVAEEGPYALCSGSLCETVQAYRSGKVPKEVIKEKFKKQVDIFVKNGVDLLIAEYISHVGEAELMVEVMKASGKPTAVTLAIGKDGDRHGVLPGECALRLARAGADIIGVNCRFDPERSLEVMKEMQHALKKEGIKMHYMVQPLGFWTPDANALGFIGLAEFPFAMDPRALTRWDCHKFARKAYDMGIRYIGGCCGFEPHHIRALAEELSPERGRLPLGTKKHGLWGESLNNYTVPHLKVKANRAFWENLQPATGRPYSAPLSEPAGEWHD